MKTSSFSRWAVAAIGAGVFLMAGITLGTIILFPELLISRESD